jgi:tetraacyldisaccharide 4'-kinase
MAFLDGGGSDAGFLPDWLAPLAAPLAGCYGAVVAARALAYRRGWLSIHRAPVPVISIGNLTAGGGGKTPFADYLLREAGRAGLRPACLSRGYGRVGRSKVARVQAAEGIPADPVALGDEPCMLAMRNPQVPIYVGADRRDSARLAHILDGAEVLILDDGFQHLRLARHLNILLVDAQRGLGNGRLLPAGPLREPASALARADVIVITKANLGDAQTVERTLIHKYQASRPIYRSDYEPGRLRRLDGKATLPITGLQGARVSLICGIAQPEGFRRTVAQAGAEIRELIAFSDHFPYPDVALQRIENLTQAADPRVPEWITTEKDAVKLGGRLSSTDRLWVLEMEVVPEPSAQAFFFDSLHRLTVR